MVPDNFTNKGAVTELLVEKTLPVHQVILRLP